jgi:hypothetical protein
VALTRRYELSQTRWIEDIRRALGALDGIEMDEGVRKTIFRCLQAEAYEARDRFEDLMMNANDGKRWTDEEDGGGAGFRHFDTEGF